MRVDSNSAKCYDAFGINQELYEQVKQDALLEYRTIKNPLFNYATQVLPNVIIVEKIVQVLTAKTLPLNELAQQSGIDLGEIVLAVAVLAKMDLVRLDGFNTPI